MPTGRYHRAMAMQGTEYDSGLVGESAALSAAACLFRGFGEPFRLAILRHLTVGEHRVMDLTAHVAHRARGTGAVDGLAALGLPA